MTAHRRFVSAVLAGLLLTGCAAQEKSAAAPPLADEPASVGSTSAEKVALRNNAASLLYDLLGDEKDVSKVLYVKHGSKSLHALIQTISTTAQASRKQLEEIAQQDPQLNLQVMDLPVGEKAARASEGKSKEHDLLFSSGAEFEYNLLLTQAEALNYGWHLAKVAGANSPDTAEAQTFQTLAQLMENLFHQVARRMQGNPG